ncbi:phospholipase D family protein [Cellulosimicrobium cellulans]|uniref:phospholipase D family protein n=1 Tax=Cellulosimicrobium cellulans TaxID=1710 RepID=UPI00130D6A47|nr:phospholipase D family protein [Cellulosimicrobium cellulans]
MTARFVHQPYTDSSSDLHDFLTGVASDPAFTDVRVAVAWAKRSGIRRIRSCIAAVQDRGGRFEIILGIDEGGGTAQGLRLAWEAADSARVFHDPSGRTFHPKVFLAFGPTRARLFVGSHNLTAGGTYFNYEAGVILELDRSDAGDESVLASVIEYFERLEADAGVCKVLDEALVDTLIRDPRYRIGDEESDRARENAAPGPANDGIASIFEPSLFPKRRDPAAQPATSADGGVVSPAFRVPASGSGPSATLAGEGERPERVIRRWNKQMTKSDCGRPNPNSHTTGALRFTKAQQPIDQAVWPRHRLFGHLPWQPDPRYSGREMVVSQFEVTIHGNAHGLYQLVLKHDGRRESSQNNFTTDLKWALLPPGVRQDMSVDDWISVELREDGSLHLTVTADAPLEGFFDDPIGSVSETSVPN